MSKPVLCFDIGNTRAKYMKIVSGKAVCSGSFPVARLIHYNACLNWIDELCKEAEIDAVSDVVICSVLLEKTEFVSEVSRDLLGVRPIVLDNATSFLSVPYTGFGIDRTMALLGAKKLYPDSHLIVVDAGTAITVDALGRDGKIYAGLIAPGPDGMLEALVGKSGKLPLLTFAPSFKVENESTEACMQYGVSSALVGMVREAVSAFQNSLFTEAPAFVVGTGGYIGALSDTGLLSCIHDDLVFTGCIEAYENQKRIGG